MGKKNSGGKKFKQQKKASNKTRELVYREDNQSYARIIKTLGDSRFECECLDLNETKIGHMRGAFRKRVWMGVGDIVLVSMRDFDEKKCDIIHKYTTEEAMMLKTLGEIDMSVNIQATSLEISNENLDSNDDIFFEDI